MAEVSTSGGQLPVCEDAEMKLRIQQQQQHATFATREIIEHFLISHYTVLDFINANELIMIITFTRVKYSSFFIKLMKLLSNTVTDMASCNYLKAMQRKAITVSLKNLCTVSKWDYIRNIAR